MSTVPAQQLSLPGFEEALGDWQQEYQNQPGGQEKFSAVPLSMNGRSMKMQDQGRGAKLAMQASLPAIESNLYSLQTSHVLEHSQSK